MSSNLTLTALDPNDITGKDRSKKLAKEFGMLGVTLAAALFVAGIVFAILGYRCATRNTVAANDQQKDAYKAQRDRAVMHLFVGGFLAIIGTIIILILGLIHFAG